MNSGSFHQKTREMPGGGAGFDVTGGLEGRVAAFLEWKRINQGRSTRTIDVYALALRRLGEFLGGRDWQAVVLDDLLLFTGKWLFDRGLADPLSRKTHVSAVREFFRWAVARGEIRRNPAAGVPHARVGRKLPRVMTIAHAERLIWAPDFATFEGVRDAAIIALLVGCGLRVSGLVSLNMGNVIAQEINGRPRLVVRSREKGDKDRQVPIPFQADLLLRVYLEHPELAKIDRLLASGDQVLFVSCRNRSVPAHEYRGEARRLSDKGVQRMLLKYARQAGVPLDLAHPHALRHMFGTELAEDDVPTNTAARLLGHDDPKNTKIYEHLAMRKLTKVVDKSNPLAKMRTPVSDLLAAMYKKR